MTGHEEPRFPGFFRFRANELDSSRKHRARPPAGSAVGVCLKRLAQRPLCAKSGNPEKSLWRDCRVQQPVILYGPVRASVRTEHRPSWGRDRRFQHRRDSQPAQSALGSCDRGPIAAGDSVLTNTPETAAAFGNEGSVRVGRHSCSRSRRGWVSTRTSLGFCMPCMLSEATDTSCRRR